MYWTLAIKYWQVSHEIPSVIQALRPNSIRRETMISKDIMADLASSNRVDSNRNTIELDLTSTLERKRKIARIVKICGIILSTLFITCRDGCGLYYLLTIKDKAVSVSRWFSVSNLALNLIMIGFFGDAIRRIHLS